MSTHLESGTAASCVKTCEQFIREVGQFNTEGRHGSQSLSADSFDTARQIGTVYSLFAGEDLRTLLNGFVTQVEAMSVLFAAAGGLIEAQDEAVAVALGKAAQEPAGLQSVGLMNALATLHSPAAMAVISGGLVGTAQSPEVGGYDRVGPEDVSTTPLERIVTAAAALDPSQFSDVRTQVLTAANTLDSAATSLRADLGDILGGAWQGEFAAQGAEMSHALTRTAFDLVTELEKVATRADGAHAGFETTRTNIASEALKITLDQARNPGTGSGPGAAHGPATPAMAEAAAAARAAAEEQARAVVNTEYSPAVMAANLDDLHFPTAFRVISTTALGGAAGIDPLTAWNTGGIPQTAGAAARGQAAMAAAGITSGSGPTGGGAGALADTDGVGAGATGVDSATEQALLASRATAGDTVGVGAVTGTSGPGGGTGPVNAATTAAGAPLAPVPGTGQQGAGAGGSGIRGLRGGGTGTGQAGRDRDRGFGGAAGLVGGGGAAATGAGASRMGGAGTLAGLGSPAGPGSSAPVTGGPGPGAGTAGGAGAAGSGVGPASSSSSSGTPAAGRPGAMPMGMMGGAAAGAQGSDRRGHTPAGYLTNATNTTEIIGAPVKVAPAVLGRPTAPLDPTPSAADAEPTTPAGRVLGRTYTGGGAPKNQA